MNQPEFQNSCYFTPPKWVGLLTAGSLSCANLDPVKTTLRDAQLRSPVAAYHRSSQPAGPGRTCRAQGWHRVKNAQPTISKSIDGVHEWLIYGWLMVVWWLVNSWLMVDLWKWWFVILDIWWIHGSKWLVMCDVAGKHWLIVVNDSWQRPLMITAEVWFQPMMVHEAWYLSMMVHHWWS